jgi:hypothetical protein
MVNLEKPMLVDEKQQGNRRIQDDQRTKGWKRKKEDKVRLSTEKAKKRDRKFIGPTKGAIVPVGSRFLEGDAKAVGASSVGAGGRIATNVVKRHQGPWFARLRLVHRYQKIFPFRERN